MIEIIIKGGNGCYQLNSFDKFPVLSRQYHKGHWVRRWYILFSFMDCIGPLLLMYPRLDSLHRWCSSSNKRLKHGVHTSFLALAWSKPKCPIYLLFDTTDDFLYVADVTIPPFPRQGSCHGTPGFLCCEEWMVSQASFPRVLLPLRPKIILFFLVISPWTCWPGNTFSLLLLFVCFVFIPF